MDKELKEFLAERKIEKSLIDHFENEKIDAVCFSLMELDQLKQYFQSKGDQMAIKNFCTNLLKNKDRDNIKKKLIENIKETFNISGTRKRKSNNDEKEVIEKKQGRMKTIEFGWINRSQNEFPYTKLPENITGGPKKIPVSLDMDRSDLLKVVKENFFPNGMSHKGGICDFKFDIVDKCHDSLESQTTLEEILGKRKYKVPALFLATTELSKKGTSATFNLKWNNRIVGEDKDYEVISCKMISYDNIQNASLTDLISKSKRTFFPKEGTIRGDSEKKYIVLGLYTDEKKLNEETDLQGLLDQNGNCSLHFRTLEMRYETEAVTSAVEEDFASKLDLPTTSRGSSTSHQLSESVNNTSSASPSTSSSHSRSNDTRRISLWRNKVFEQLNSYIVQDPRILESDIRITLLDQNDVSEPAVGQGVFKEALGQYWKTFYESYCYGTTLKIPVINRSLNKGICTAIAKVLKKGYEDFSLIPLRLCRSLLEHCLYGKTEEEILIKDFLLMISEEEKNSLERAGDILTDKKEKCVEKLLEVLGKYDLREKLTLENYKNVIKEIAEVEIITKRKFLIDIWHEELQHLASILPEKKIREMYEVNDPSPANIINRLKTEEENKIFNYLLQFLIDNPDLGAAFVHFATGLYTLTDEDITVAFYEIRDEEKDYSLIKTGICFNTVTFPKRFDEYQEFETELTFILGGSQNFGFNSL